MEQRLLGLGNAFIQQTDGGQVYFRKNVGGYEWPHVEWYDPRYVRQKARIFDGTAWSFVYPGAMATPLLPLIG